MTVVPRFAYPPGTELRLFSRKLLLNRLTDTGYEFADHDEGTISVVPFLKLVEFLGLPGTTIDTQVALTGRDLAIRLGDYVSWTSLPKEQQEKAQLHHALCQAMSMLQDNIRRDTERPGFCLSIRKLDEPQNRVFICKVASSLLEQPVRLAPPRGGMTDCCILYTFEEGRGLRWPSRSAPIRILPKPPFCGTPILRAQWAAHPVGRKSRPCSANLKPGPSSDQMTLLQPSELIPVQPQQNRLGASLSGLVV